MNETQNPNHETPAQAVIAMAARGEMPIEEAVALAARIVEAATLNASSEITAAYERSMATPNAEIANARIAHYRSLLDGLWSRRTIDAAARADIHEISNAILVLQDEARTHAEAGR